MLVVIYVDVNHLSWNQDNVFMFATYCSYPARCATTSFLDQITFSQLVAFSTCFSDIQHTNNLNSLTGFRRSFAVGTLSCAPFYLALMGDSWF